MRILVGGAGAAVLAAVLAVAAGGGSAAASCAATLTWRGAGYVGVGGERLPAGGAVLTPKAVIPPCDDTPGAHARATRQAVRRVAGVDPGLAVFSASALFVVDGAFTTLPGHPLHRALWGSARKPFRAGDHRRCRVRGRVVAAGTSEFELARAGGGGRHVQVAVDAGTAIAGARLRGGQPFLAGGDVVDVRARRCTADGRDVTAVRVGVAPA